MTSPEYFLFSIEEGRSSKKIKMSLPWSLPSSPKSGQDSPRTTFSSGIFTIPCEPGPGPDFTDARRYLFVPETGIDSGEGNLQSYIDDSFLKYVNVDTSLLQKWFANISWQSKLSFIRRLTEIMKESSIAYDLITFIGPPTKDFIYSQTQFPGSAYDVQPLDHNRSTIPQENDVQSDGFVKWFQTMPQIVQLCVSLSLLQIGGSRMAFRVYTDLFRFAERQERQIRDERMLKYREILEKYNASSAKEMKHLMDASQKGSRRRSRNSRRQREGSSTRRSETLSRRDLDPITLAKLRLKKRHADFDRMLVRLDRMDGSGGGVSIGGQSRPKTNKKINSTIDHVQLLPLWINRRTIKMLPERMRTVSNVNEYWKSMVERIRKEEKTRKKMNVEINKYQKKMKINRGVIPKTHETKEKSKCKIDKTDPENDQKKTTKLSTRDPARYFSIEGQMVKSFVRSYKDVLLNENFCEDRKIHVSKKWCASSLNRDVEFCNLKTGALWPHRLTDCHDGVRITCLAIHPDGQYLFTGSVLGTVKMHDIWRNEVRRTYGGHTGCITHVACTDENVASCSVDYTILIHDNNTGEVILKEIEPGIPSHVIFSPQSRLFYSASGEGVIQCYVVPPYLTENTCKYRDAVAAHKGEITSLSVQGKVILTTGVDGQAKIWTRHTLAPIRGVFQHKTRINSGAIVFGKLIVVTEDGLVKIWDVLSGLLLRVILGNVNRRPILSLSQSIDRFNIKLILNNEANIKLFVFPIKRPVRNRKISFLKSKKMGISATEKRQVKNYLRNAVHPELHNPPMSQK